MSRRDDQGRRIVLTVYCGRCADEGRSTREELGRVVSDGYSSKWLVYDRRRRRLPNPGESLPDLVAKVGPLPGEEFLAGVPLVVAGISHYRPPSALFAFCKRHGRGQVASNDVLNASGSVVLNFIAQA